MDSGCGDRERERLGVGWQAEDSRATRDRFGAPRDSAGDRSGA